MNVTEIRPPRPAATILLLREFADQIEVLMVRRHANLAFMGGAWVFPGGSLDPADMSEAALALLDVDAVARRTSMLDIHGQPLRAVEAAGLVFAACRETFEETGVLLARSASGTSPTAAQLDRAQARRADVIETASLFPDLLRTEGLYPDLASLAYWAHWITPSSVQRRFDTRFFIVKAPDSQHATADTGETDESAWMAPQVLLEAARQGQMRVSHPTQCNLHDLQSALSRYRSLDELLTGEAHRRVLPIMPKMNPGRDGMTIIMPWDPSYEQAPGDGIALADGGTLSALPSLIPVDR